MLIVDVYWLFYQNIIGLWELHYDAVFQYSNSMSLTFEVYPQVHDRETGSYADITSNNSGRLYRGKKGVMFQIP